MSQSNSIVGIQLHRLIIIKRTSGDLINVANSCTSILASIDTLRICESHTESKRLLQIAKIAMNSFAQGQAMNIIIFTVLAIIVGKSISILDFLSITAQHNVILITGLNVALVVSLVCDSNSHRQCIVIVNHTRSRTSIFFYFVNINTSATLINA